MARGRPNRQQRAHLVVEAPERRVTARRPEVVERGGGGRASRVGLGEDAHVRLPLVVGDVLLHHLLGLRVRVRARVRVKARGRLRPRLRLRLGLRLRLRPRLGLRLRPRLGLRLRLRLRVSGLGLGLGLGFGSGSGLGFELARQHLLIGERGCGGDPPHPALPRLLGRLRLRHLRSRLRPARVEALLELGRLVRRGYMQRHAPDGALHKLQG